MSEYRNSDDSGYRDIDPSKYSHFAWKTHLGGKRSIGKALMAGVCTGLLVFNPYLSLLGGQPLSPYEKKIKKDTHIGNIYHALGPEHVKKIPEKNIKEATELLGAASIGVKFDNPHRVAKEILGLLRVDELPHKQKEKIVKEVYKTVGAYQRSPHDLSLMDIGKYLYNECKQDIGNGLKSLEGYFSAFAKNLIKNPFSSGTTIKPEKIASYAGNNTTMKINETGLQPYNTTTFSSLNETMKNVTKAIKKKLPGFNITEIWTKGKWENEGYEHVPSSAKKVKIGKLIKSIEKYLGFGNNTEKDITYKEVPFQLAEYNQTSGKTTRINGSILVIESADHPVIYNLTTYTHKNLQKVMNIGNKIKQITSDYVTIGINPTDYIRGIKTNSTKLNQTIMKYIAPFSENMTNITALNNSSITPNQIYQSLKNKLNNSSIIFIKGPDKNPYLTESGTKLAYIIKINKTVKKPVVKWLKDNMGIFNFITKENPTLTVSNYRDMTESLTGGNGGGGIRGHGSTPTTPTGTGFEGGHIGSGTGGSMFNSK